MKKRKIYAVKLGKDKNGKLIRDAYFDNWEACSKVVDGFSHAIVKSFYSMLEAEEWLKSIDGDALIKEYSTRHIKGDKKLLEEGLNMQVINVNTKNMVLTSTSSKEERNRKAIFAVKMPRNPFVKKILYQKQKGICEF